MKKCETNKSSCCGRRSFLKCAATGLSLSTRVGLSAASGLFAVATQQSVWAKNEPTLVSESELSVEPVVPRDLPSTDVDILDPMESRRLHLVNAHTWDDLDVVYYTHGIYIDENIHHLNHLMRDRRANVTASIDTHLYDQLLKLQRALGTTEPVHVLSGYRTPETNAKLRKRSAAVAKYSLHMEGRAADIYIPGVSVEKLRQAAIDMQAGGVGVYSRSNFIHIDTGPIRHWGK